MAASLRLEASLFGRAGHARAQKRKPAVGSCAHACFGRQYMYSIIQIFSTSSRDSRVRALRSRVSRLQPAAGPSRGRCEPLTSGRKAAAADGAPGRLALTNELLVKELTAASRRHGHALKAVRGLIGTILQPSYPKLLRVADMDLFVGPAALEPTASALATVLEEGARSGEVRVCDFGAAARVVLGLTLWAPVVMPTPLVGVERRRAIEGLQDLVTYGCIGDRAEPPRGRLLDAPSAWPVDADGSDAVLASASFLLNRRPYASMEEIAAFLRVSPDTLRLRFGERDRLVSACHRRTLAIFLRIQDAAIVPGPLTAASVRRLVHATTLSYLRRDLQPLGPLAALGGLDAEGVAKARLRWAGLWLLLQERWIDGVGVGELRERHHHLAPRFWLALCSCLAGGLSDEGPDGACRVAESVAELICAGLAPGEVTERISAQGLAGLNP